MALGNPSRSLLEYPNTEYVLGYFFPSTASQVIMHSCLIARAHLLWRHVHNYMTLTHCAPFLSTYMARAYRAPFISTYGLHD